MSPAGSPEAVTPKHKLSAAGTPTSSATKGSIYCSVQILAYRLSPYWWVRWFSKLSLVASPAQKSSEKKKESQSRPKPEPKLQKATSKNEQQVPFNRILEGVVFVLSGFQNPFRGELREKALDMGAKYRPDWTPDSTHLLWVSVRDEKGKCLSVDT